MKEQLVEDIVKEVIAKMQLEMPVTKQLGVFTDMNKAIEAAKEAQAIVRNMSMDQRERIISIIRKKTQDRKSVV